MFPEITSYELRTSRAYSRSVTGAAKLTDRGSDCFYKICPANVSSEANTLSFACEVAETFHCLDIPRTIGIDSEKNILFMDRLSVADNLFNYFWNDSFLILKRPRVDASDCGRALGGWLRFFQRINLHGETLDRINLEVEFLRGIGGRLESIAEIKPKMIPLNQRKAIVMKCKSLMESDGAAVEQTRIHGDLNLSNILVLKNGNFAVIDFGDSRPGLCLEDVGIAYHNLYLVSELKRARGANALMHSFLGAYVAGDRAYKRCLLPFRVKACLIQIARAISLQKPSRSTKRLLQANLQWLKSSI